MRGAGVLAEDDGGHGYGPHAVELSRVTPPDRPGRGRDADRSEGAEGDRRRRRGGAADVAHRTDVEAPFRQEVPPTVRVVVRTPEQRTDCPGPYHLSG